MEEVSLKAPRPIHPDDELAAFRSGNDVLDRWLKTRALRNEGFASRTYVACAGKRVGAWYSLAAGSFIRGIAPGSIKRNMPDPVPAMILARLAVDLKWQSRGIGRALIQDAMTRTTRVSEIAGIRALVVHAIDAQAAAFYRHCGFLPSPVEEFVLMFPLRLQK